VAEQPRSFLQFDRPHEPVIPSTMICEQEIQAGVMREVPQAGLYNRGSRTRVHQPSADGLPEAATGKLRPGAIQLPSQETALARR
jgi:hypothetical protein